MSSLVCLIIRKKNCYKHRQRKRKKRYAHLKKKEGENIIDTVTHKRHKKNKLWIIIIPMMDLENRQTFNKKKKDTDIRTNKINSKRELCSRVKKNMLIHISLFESSKL
jgi:hypothetical protein